MTLTLTTLTMGFAWLLLAAVGLAELLMGVLLWWAIRKFQDVERVNAGLSAVTAEFGTLRKKVLSELEIMDGYLQRQQVRASRAKQKKEKSEDDDEQPADDFSPPPGVFFPSLGRGKVAS